VASAPTERWRKRDRNDCYTACGSFRTLIYSLEDYKNDAFFFLIKKALDLLSHPKKNYACFSNKKYIFAFDLSATLTPKALDLLFFPPPATAPVLFNRSIERVRTVVSKNSLHIDKCKLIELESHLERSTAALVAKILIIFFGGIHLMKDLYQLIQVQLRCFLKKLNNNLKRKS
jgi:hypothetical protein